MNSKANSLNSTDYKKLAKNALIFCIPALLVLLSNIQTALPNYFHNPAYSAIFIFLVERAIDTLRKYKAGK